jgi:hypothetical protein
LGKAVVILTFGDPDWQKAKVDAVLGGKGYGLPVVYTEEKIKSEVLSQAWSVENQEYKLGMKTASSIVGVGDELADFTGYERLSNARGYLKKDMGDKQYILPDNVVNIHSLDEINLSE